MNKIDDFKKIVGVYGLISWLETLKKIGYNYSCEKNIYRFDKEVSKSLFVGKWKIKGKTETFIGVDTFFAKWAKLIKWDYININIEDKEIALVSKEIISEELDDSYFPAFALIFKLDLAEKIININNLDKVILREYYIDSDGAIKTNRFKETAKLRVVKASNLTLETKDLKELKSEKIIKEIEKETTLGNSFQNSKI